MSSESPRRPDPDAGSAHEFLLEADSDVRLDSLVASRLDRSRTQAATLIAQGRVTIDGRLEKASYRPKAGERVVVLVPPPEPRRPITGERIPLVVAYEDDEVVVIDKPAGMVVHPAPGNWSGTLVNALLGRDEAFPAGNAGSVVTAESAESAGGTDRAGIVHRLDKDTSGLLIVAKTERAHRILSRAIAERRVSRRYAVLSWGHVDGDRLTVEKPIGRDPRDRKRMAIVSTGRPARTDFVRLARFDAVDLLRAHLHSGRTHQIRVHLASIGHPVVGDDTYGGGGGRRLVALPPRRHFLHAAWLIFQHPTNGERIELRSPLPEDLARSIVAVAGWEDAAAHPDPLDELGFFRLDG